MSKYFCSNYYFNVDEMCSDYGLNYKDMPFEPDPELIDDKVYWHPSLIDEVLDFINEDRLTKKVYNFLYKRNTWL